MACATEYLPGSDALPSDLEHPLGDFINYHLHPVLLWPDQL